MELVTIATLAMVFLFVASVTAGMAVAVGRSRTVELIRARKRLQYLSAGEASDRIKPDLLKNSEQVGMDGLERILQLLPRPARLERLLLRAGVRFGPTTFLLITTALGLAGLMIGLRFLPMKALSVVPMVGLAAIPWVALLAAAERSLRKFEEQLPDALDMMTRALRAGHALNTAVEMVGEEMPEPIAPEFTAVSDEVRLGLSLGEALENLSHRVPLTDLRFFAVTVALHRETGGNLTEIFEKISRLIRERQQFRRQVEALTAEGRFSAVVLVFLPLAMALYLFLTNRSYIEPLWADPAGRIMSVAGVIFMTAGYFVMRRMAKLEM
jgi:tight adherence protein B